MHIYMISYDLNSPTSNREKVENSIKSIGNWCKFLTTTFLVKTSRGIYDVEDTVTASLDSNDRMIIVEITKPIRGFLTQDEWNLIKQYL